jgi:hypothetical protein
MQVRTATLDAYASAFDHELMDQTRRLLGESSEIPAK